MLLKDYQYEHALDVPFDDWSKFDRDKDKIIESLEYRFGKKKAEKIYKIVDANWNSFEGHEAVVIKVEDYDCLAIVTDEFTPIEISDFIYPFDDETIYPMQMLETKFYFKRH